VIEGPAVRPVNLLTVDLEEWFHVCAVGGDLAEERWDRLPSRVDSTTRLLMDLLDRAQVPAMFFVVGWIAEHHPQLIADIRAAGHDIGSHSYSHTRAYELGPAAFRDDLRRSVRALAAVDVATVACFRAPEWSINDRSLWALDVLVDEGFTVDASMAPLRIVGSVGFPRAPYQRQVAGGSILELPPLVADRLGQVMPMGWGWGLRMSSPARVKKAIDRANARGAGAVLTVHPWELDPDPPRAKLPPRLHFAHYFRLSGFRDRLREILHGTTFGRVSDVAV
jgi:polysaccharide deacetylase family protein (PEP-CTERM system associated)